MSELRLAERPAYCRYCDGLIHKGEKMFSFYSRRNTGMYIHLHTSCIESMNNLIVKEKHETTIGI